MYRMLRTFLFFFPAEEVHHFSMKMLKVLCGWSVTRRMVAWACRPEDQAAMGAGALPVAGTAENASPVPGTAGNASPVAGTVGASLVPDTAGASPVAGTVGASLVTNTPGSAAATANPSMERTGNRSLARTVLGLRFSNPVGLGAGFDKNALYLRELEALGFGFVEIGTVTPRPQPGNEQPRLFRLPQDQALINRMGFNNEGVEAVAARLRSWRAANAAKARSGASANRPGLIIGGNIGKNKATPNEEAWKDYDICFRALYNDVDYFVVNVSSPNTPGLRELQEKDALHRILTSLQQIRTELTAAGAPRRPLLLKIAPDLSPEQLDDVVALALEIGLDGLVAANTTISRERLLTPADRLESIGAGGLSGAPLRERATEVIAYLAARSGGRIPIIASGGIFTAANAREKLAAGAALVQVWTGFIYEGPFIVNRICRGLSENTVR